MLTDSVQHAPGDAPGRTFNVKTSCVACARYCSRSDECNRNPTDSQVIDACKCSFQCSRACTGFCAGPGGRRHMLMAQDAQPLFT